MTAPSIARWFKKIKCVGKIVHMNWTMWLTWWIWCWWILHSRFNLVHIISFPNQRNFPAAQKFSSRNLIYQICTWTHLGRDWSLFHFRWQPNLSGSVNCRLEPVNLIQYNFESISYNFESRPAEILWFFSENISSWKCYQIPVGLFGESLKPIHRKNVFVRRNSQKMFS